MKLKDVMLIVAVALLPMGCSTSGPQTFAQANFNKLDINHDGYISESEAKAYPELAKDWKSVDVHNKGKIDESEFSAFEVEQYQNTYQPGGE